MNEERLNIKDIIFFALLISGTITLIVSIIAVVAEIYLRDHVSIFEKGFVPTRAFIGLVCFMLVIIFVFLYIPLKLGIYKKTISRKSGIVSVTLLTYLLCSFSLAVFLSLTTQIIDYDELRAENFYTYELRNNNVPCTFDLRESFFDAVSGFTTTGLTAFRRTYVYDVYGNEISKVDAQPGLIHIIRAAYLWIGGLGIMFFYLYFTPIPSLMMTMGYEMPAERSLPRFIRLEGLSFSLVYAIITVIGVLFLFLAISSTFQHEITYYEADINTRTADHIEKDIVLIPRKDDSFYTKNALTHSIVLSFSSISTGGFSLGSASVDQLRVDLPSCIGVGPQIINKWGLLVITTLMLAGAMPIFSLHRPLKYFRRWKIFALFLLPILVYAMLSYTGDMPEVSVYRSFDAISAFTTTGFYTSQFVKDSEMPLKLECTSEYEKEDIKEIYGDRLQKIYMIVLMFIGGATYSTAGGWGFFNFFCIIYAFFLILNGKTERVLKKYILRLILSFLIFFGLFVLGTVGCYMSGLFGTLSGPEPASVVDYVVNSAFFEISALSTAGLMPDSMLQGDGIYYNTLAYITLAVSMLIGRLYYIIFPFLVLLITPEGGI